jgi:hypothetical protein
MSCSVHPDICNKRLGMPLRCAAKKPLLTEKIVRKRMTFCKHQAWSEKDWEDIIFSDIYTFRLVNPSSQKVRRSSMLSLYKQKCGDKC